jgi:hypothetical protein
MKDGGMHRHQTTLLEFRGSARLADFATAVSLHAHTNRSREVMTAVPRYLQRIPLVAPLVRREMRAYARRNGRPVDFAKGWWHPPVSPQMVLESETSQILGVLELRPLVSITDHDNIDAGLELQRQHPCELVPVSFEWTVPFHGGFFHLGVHNLRPDSASALVLALSAYTRQPGRESLPDLLQTLNRDRDTLVVLNHPLWDLAGIGSAHHVALLRRFLFEHGTMIHALELNGYRSWRENSGVRTLAEADHFPLISGGDRHGCAPNSLLNLTSAASFGEFVREVREDRQSVILVMPPYRTELVARKLAVAADAIRWYPSYPPGQQRWTDRVSYERQGVVKSLSEHWPDGGPVWVRCAMRAFQLGATAPLLPLLRTTVRLAGAASSDHAGPASLMEASSGPGASCNELLR